MKPCARNLLLLIAILALTATGCSSLRSKPPTEIVRTPPVGCLTPSTKLTSPQSNSADAVYLYLIDVIGQYGDLARMHDSCVQWHTKDLKPKAGSEGK